MISILYALAIAAGEPGSAAELDRPADAWCRGIALNVGGKRTGLLSVIVTGPTEAVEKLKARAVELGAYTYGSSNPDLPKGTRIGFKDTMNESATTQMLNDADKGVFGPLTVEPVFFPLASLPGKCRR